MFDSFVISTFNYKIQLQNHTVHGRWDLESILWYLGGDSKRNTPTRY